MRRTSTLDVLSGLVLMAGPLTPLHEGATTWREQLCGSRNMWRSPRDCSQSVVSTEHNVQPFVDIKQIVVVERVGGLSGEASFNLVSTKAWPQIC